jgi:tetratricopeptide (TPR) repeat protein
MHALLAGCSSLVPQTYAQPTGWPEGVPQQIELRDVPFFPQQDYQCGPAALATVLGASGVDVRPEPLVDQVWLPARRGSLQLEMLSTPRRYERISYRLAPSYGDMLREIAAGNPVVVLQDVGLLGTQWHYAVVNGFDYATGTLYLRSGTEARHEMPFTAFERGWMKGHYWAMVVTPPDRIAATADENRWLEAVSSFARTAAPASAASAYRTALKRWPDNVQAAIGLANHLHAQGALEQAAAVLRTALDRHPQSIIVLNNLAQTVSDQGRHSEALALIEKATDPQSPFAAEVRATRLLILQRSKSATR